MNIDKLIETLQDFRERRGNLPVKYRNFCAIHGEKIIDCKSVIIYTDERLPKNEQTWVDIG